MKKLVLMFLLASAGFLSEAQNNLNVNLFLGTSNYSGDLQDKQFTFSQAHLA
jgi:hypothetical protein